MKPGHYAILFGLAGGLVLLASCGRDSGQAQTRTAAKDLKSAQPGKRASAFSRLITKEPSPRKVEKLLAKALGDESPVVLEAALGAVASLEEPSDACVEKIRKLVTEGTDPRIRLSAMDALCKIAPEEGETGEALVEALEDEDLVVAIRAATKLLAISDRAAGASEAIANVIRRSVEASVSPGANGSFGAGEVAVGLARLGGSASAAVPILRSAHGTPRLPQHLRSFLMNSIRAISGQTPVERLNEQLESLLSPS